MGAFLERGRILFFQHGHYADAEREFLRALQDDPDSAEAHALLGLARNRLNRADEALASCREAVRLAPEWSYPHYALGYVLEKNDRFEEAAKALEEAIRLSPLTAYFHSHLAFTRHRQGRYADALACADEGLRCDGQHVDSLNRRAMALAALDRFEEAEQTSRTAASLAPEDASTLANFGYVLYKRNNAAEALGVLRETLRLDPGMAWAREVMTDTLVLLLEQGRPAAVAKHIPDAVLRDPEQEAERERLLQAAAKPALNRLNVPVSAVWALATAATALATQEPRVWIVLVLLAACQLVYARRVFVLVEPLAYPLLRRDAVARLFLRRRQAWAFAAVTAALLATAAAGAAALWTQAPEARIVLFLTHAQVLPIAYVINSAARPVRDEMTRAAVATLGFAGILIGALLDRGTTIMPGLLIVSEIVFCWGVGGVGLAARVFADEKKTRAR
jgi:tetratricopeptide (TPR) repeat protein